MIFNVIFLFKWLFIGVFFYIYSLLTSGAVSTLIMFWLLSVFL